MQSNLEHELEAELEGELEFEGELEHEHGEHEFEAELEHEHGEHEFEGELEHEYGEHEFEGELEHEHGEHEFEGELEHEHGEQFFGKIFRGVRQLARVAAPIVGKVVAGALPGPFGALAGQGLNALLREHEHEHEHEHELGEHEVSHELGEHEAMAEAMAQYAAQAEHELEAEAMVGAATTITISARDRRALRRFVPRLVRGAAILTRILRLRRRTRPLVCAVPTIVRRTVRALRRSAAAGRPITRRRAGAIMARQTRRVLSSPRYSAAVLRRNVRASRAVIRPRSMRRRRRTF